MVLLLSTQDHIPELMNLKEVTQSLTARTPELMTMPANLKSRRTELVETTFYDRIPQLMNLHSIRRHDTKAKLQKN